MTHDDPPLSVSRCVHCRHLIRLPTTYCPICKSDDPLGTHQPSERAVIAMTLLTLFGIATATVLLVFVLLHLR